MVFNQSLKDKVISELYCNVSSLMTELCTNIKYSDDILDICWRSDYEETLEFWAVSNWLAKKLEENGEAVLFDFYGLDIWGRCTSGQAIFLDSVIQKIYGEL